MTDAILGTYSDFKLVKTRSVVQVVIEVPLERAHEVTNLLGLPLPGAEIPVALARLRPEAIASRAQIAAGEDDTPTPRPLSQVSAILCGIGAFRKFLVEQCGATGPLDNLEAAEHVRKLCGVKSRKELDTDDIAAQKFRNLRSNYDAWMRVAA